MIKLGEIVLKGVNWVLCLFENRSFLVFCHKNQSWGGGGSSATYSKSPKMDKSEVKNFPHSEGEGGGGAFLPKF